MTPLLSLPILTAALLALSAAMTEAVACTPPPGGCCTGAPFNKTQNGIQYTCKITSCLTGPRLESKESCFPKVPGAGLPVLPPSATVPGQGTPIPKGGGTIPGTSGSTHE